MASGVGPQAHLGVAHSVDDAVRPQDRAPIREGEAQGGAALPPEQGPIAEPEPVDATVEILEEHRVVIWEHWHDVPHGHRRPEFPQHAAVTGVEADHPLVPAVAEHVHLDARDDHASVGLDIECVSARGRRGTRDPKLLARRHAQGENPAVYRAAEEGAVHDRGAGGHLLVRVVVPERAAIGAELANAVLGCEVDVLLVVKEATQDGSVVPARRVVPAPPQGRCEVPRPDVGSHAVLAHAAPGVRPVVLAVAGFLAAGREGAGERGPAQPEELAALPRRRRHGRSAGVRSGRDGRGGPWQEG
mmetsp:Transcript_13598/g.39673  ORF Transcript_13598/g.39673 Transcript_13598/m.39673 type:complete len:302 (+) Transcript_13598:955-1860(+)